MALEILVEDLSRRDAPVGMQLKKSGPDLPSAPAMIATLSELEGSVEDMRFGSVGAGGGPVGPVKQTIGAFGLIPLKPLVAGLSADAVASAKFGVGEQATEGLEDESLSFVHGIGLQPRHGPLLVGGPRYGSRLSPISVEKSVTYQRCVYLPHP